MKHSVQPPITVRRFVRETIRPFWNHIMGAVCLCSLWAVDQSFRPYLIKLCFDRMTLLSHEEAASQLVFLAVVFCATLAIVMFSFRLFDWIMVRMIPRMQQSIAERLVIYSMYHAHTFYQEQMAGSLASKVNDVSKGIPELLQIFIERFVENVCAVSIAIYVTSRINVLFAATMVVWVLLFIAIALGTARKSRELSDATSHERAVAIGTIVDTFSNIASVRLFTGYSYEERVAHDALGNVANAELAREHFLIKVKALQVASFLMLESIHFALLIHGFRFGYVTAGDFALILMINTTLLLNLWKISQDVTKFMKTLGEVSQGIRTIMVPHTIVDTPDARELQVGNGRIVFDSVTFHYNDTKEFFKDLSVIIEPGQKVGLVGYSGSGKSTFVNLILRLFDIQSGSISIDGYSISQVTQESLRRAIALIPQDPSLFHRTLRDNIRYGYAEATDEAVIEAARHAHAHEFIIALPGGYDHLVGERGIKLSGGQRQRISIARAFLKRPPILLLDEATSALDSVTETYIQESLHILMQHRTTLVIAHRLSTLLTMDRILVFDKGRLVEDGTHAELLANRGVYRSLWNAQICGFLPDTHNGL